MTRPAQESPAEPSGFPAHLAVLVFIAFASGHFLSYALRTLNAALAPYLVTDLGLDPGALGWLTASYFIVFAALQYPLGFWLDRFGERRVESLLLVIGAVGALVMAMGQSMTTLSLGRILIGMGVSACLMAPFAWFRRHFPPQRQSQLGLWLLVAGTSGAAMATLPAATIAEWLGWRGVLFIFAGLLAVSALLIWWVVPDPKPREPRAADAPPPMAALALIRHPAMWYVAPLAFVGHGGVMALQTLWAGPWMTDVLGIAPTWAASYLFVFTLAILASYLAMSFLTPWLQRRGIGLLRLAAWGHGMAAATILAIAVFPEPRAWLLWPLMAITFPAMSVMQPGLSLMFPREIAGRVLTLYNMYLFAGAFVLQWGIGLAVDLGLHLGLARGHAYQITLGTLALVHAGCLLFWRWRRK